MMTILHQTTDEQDTYPLKESAMAKEIGHPKTIILLVSFLVLQACNAGGGAPSEMSRRPVSYLADIVLPCKPIEGSMRDPCPQALPSVVDSVTAATYYYLPDTLRTFTEELTKLPLAVPHIVVRGTVMPGTARCGAYPVSLPNYEPGLHQRSVVDTIHYDCFVEVRVNEYSRGRAFSTHRLGTSAISYRSARELGSRSGWRPER